MAMKREINEMSKNFCTLYFSNYGELVDWVHKTRPEQFAMAPNTRESDKEEYPHTISLLRKGKRVSVA